MPAQTVLFTPIPDGIVANRIRLRVHVGPRLLTEGTLADYSDWVDWPATLTQIEWSVRFPALGKEFTVPATPATDVLPDLDVWQRLFPGSTPVKGRRMPKLTNRLLHGYSTETVSQFLKDRYGRFGAQSPDEHPDLITLLDDDGFGPIAFERFQRDGDDLSGPVRRKRLEADNAAKLDAHGADPSSWAIEHLPLPGAPDDRRDEIGRRFLELEHFHVRGRRGVQRDVLPEQHRPPTFHELVAMVQRYPTLLRVLGLVVVLEATYDEEVPVSAAGGTAVQVQSNWLPAIQHPAVYGRTMCEIGPSAFRALPKPGPASDLVGRQLRLGDPRFRVDTVDPDVGAMRSMQFADNVARSRNDPADPTHKYSAYTPDRFALPAQASGGIAVSRNDRAVTMAHLLAAVKANNDSAFDADSVPLPPVNGEQPSPLFWADDVVRGYRWDVMADADGHWRSLMGAEGVIEVGRDGNVEEVGADDEGTSVAGVTTAGGPTPPEDLYVHEALMNWSGWSLAVRPPGATVGRDDDVTDPDVPTAPDGSAPPPLAPIKARLSVPQGSLPRLRFGETYRLRARAVDIAGGGDALAAPAEPGAESAAVDYFRLEPVTAPLTALRAPVEIPGETNTVIVVRSRDAQDAAPAANHRHVLPPRTNIVVAERHGMLDTDHAGQPLDLDALSKLGKRDAQDLAMHPDIQPPGPAAPLAERWLPVDSVTLNYLPDPLAKKVLVRDLPAVIGGVGEVVLPLTAAPWPDFATTGITVDKADVTSWEPVGNRLAVHLAKGEDRFVRISSLFDPEDVDLMGLWAWIAEWHQSNGGSPAALDDLRKKVVAGQHWMFTPFQTVRLVHAVRTPLLAPVLPVELSATKDGTTPAATFANVRWTGGYSRRTTGQLELLADWEMKIDTGPGGTDPTQPRSFRAVAATIPLDHRSSGPDSGSFLVKHEFGDTKYRSVDYQAVATSAFTEFFREEAAVEVPGPGPDGKPLPIHVDDDGLVASTVLVKVPNPDGTSVELRQGPAADYTVDEASGDLLRGPLSTIVTGATLTVNYVAPAIHTRSDIRNRQIVSSARPAAPKIEYVVPTFRWKRDGNQSVRRGNALRVYLRRPWWSSGDDERLGVVLWRKPSNELDPPPSIQPYVTMWGLDPVTNGPGVTTTPVLSSFPLAVAPRQNVTLAELDGVTVDVAAHEVHFDKERDLWYADIELDFGSAPNAYFPFVRLALCRYQPHSLPGVEISPVVLADFAQVAPERTVNVTIPAGMNKKRNVHVTGRAYSANSSANEPPRMQVIFERTRAGVEDPHLKWMAVGPTVALGRAVTNGNLITWSATVDVPDTAERLVVEEVEVHRTGSEFSAISPPNGRRIVFTDTFEL
jgi:hypothetical protein